MTENNINNPCDDGDSCYDKLQQATALVHIQQGIINDLQKSLNKARTCVNSLGYAIEHYTDRANFDEFGIIVDDIKQLLLIPKFWNKNDDKNEIIMENDDSSDYVDDNDDDYTLFNPDEVYPDVSYNRTRGLSINECKEYYSTPVAIEGHQICFACETVNGFVIKPKTYNYDGIKELYILYKKLRKAKRIRDYGHKFANYLCSDDW